MITLQCLELVYSNIDFSPSLKILIFRLFKLAPNSIVCFRLKQRPEIKFLLAGKCKLYEIYGRMCDWYGEACFNQKMFTDRLNFGLSQPAWVEKTIHGVKTQ